MPCFDLPLEKLRTYTGSNPEPSDHAEYWDVALAELDATPLDFTLTPAAFQAKNVECFDLTFTGVRGAKIYAKYLRPKTQGEHPCVFHFHGYGANSGDWSQYFQYVCEGYCVAAMDVRGQGGQSQDVGGTVGDTRTGQIVRGLQSESAQDLFFRHVFLDTVQLARIVERFEEVDAARLASVGGSQGGALSIACSALHGGMKCATVQHPFLSDYKRVCFLDLPTKAYSELYDYFRHFDPCHEKEDEIFTRLGYIDVQFLAKRISNPVLFAAGLVDNTCPPSSQFAVFNRLECEKELHIYHDFAHVAFPQWSDKIHRFLAEQF